MIERNKIKNLKCSTYKNKKKLFPQEQEMVLILNKPKNLMEITKCSSYKYNTIIQKIKEFEHIGIIKTKRIRNMRLCYLTDKGKEIRYYIIQIMEAV